MANFVVDKSFLQGARGAEIKKMTAAHRILMSDALFYELLTTRPEVRARCFAKLPKGQNPVDLVSHAGVLIRHEIDTGRPSGKPSLHKEDIHFKLNSALLGFSYRLPASVQEGIDKETARLRGGVDTFLEKVAMMRTIFPGLLSGNQSERLAAHLDAEKLIVTPNSLQPFISQFWPPPDKPHLHSSENINGEWALYRWVQVQLLFGLDVYVRYQGDVPEPLSPQLYEKMEHDVLDAEQLVLGCLEGAYATREKKHIRWWALLSPNGHLYQ